MREKVKARGGGTWAFGRTFLAMAQNSGNEAVLLQQQTALARFGEFALRSDDLVAILQEACRRVCEGLRTDLAKVVELQPDGTTLLVRAGVGWRPGVVGEATSSASGDTFEGEALRTQDPVACRELTEGDRSRVAPFVLEHGVRSFVNVNILAPGGPSYGILEVDCLEPRAFTRDDVNFLRTYANLLAVVIEKLKASADLKRRAEENEQLLKELQHRIKNNLQILTGLVSFQARRTASAGVREELSKTAHRINALALVHEKLYAIGQVDRIELGGYLSDIARSLLRLHEGVGGAIRLVTDSERFDIPPELAITLGLVTNEFVTNSLKYAFENRDGAIGIELKRLQDGGLHLSLWDDGKGIPSGAPRGSGMDLIEALAKPVAGEIDWSHEKGVRLTLVVTQSAERRV
jgi:two-component sensor histidine kinase